MRRLLRLLCILSLAAAPRLAWAQAVFEDVPRIVAVGDVHGDYEQLVTILRQAGVIDGRGKWTGGRTHLVQTGDVPDRGPDSRKVMDLFIALAPQALEAGGRVHPLVGNHEAMNVLGDLRYVHPGEYAAFKGKDSERLQRRAFTLFSDSTRREDKDYRAQWLAAHPLGWVEHRLAFEGDGRYGKWIRENNAVLKLNEFLFLHGGIGPRYVDSTLAALNDGVRSVLGSAETPPRGNIAEDPEGPLWYRGLAIGGEDSLASHVDSVLRKFGVQHVVIGHSVAPGAIVPRFGGKVILIDVGLAAAYGGPAAALVIEGEKRYALHRGKLLELPLGTEPFTYLEKAAALDPEGSALRKWLEKLKAAAGQP